MRRSPSEVLRSAEAGGGLPARYAAAVLRRFVALEFFDRSLAIAAQMLVAFLPMLIGLTGLFADKSDIADELVRRFGITGSAVAMMRLLFGGDDSVDRTSWAWFGSMFFLLLSLLLLGRRVRRLYERAFDLVVASRAPWRGLVWLLVLAAVLVVPGSLRTLTVDAGWQVDALLTLGILTTVLLVCLWSPRFLLANALPWRQSAIAGGITFGGLVLVGVWSRVWLPQLILDQADRFGAIGISFSLFTWLYAVAIALVAGAVLGGAVEDVRLGRQPTSREFPV